MPELEPPIEDHYRDIHYESSNVALDFGNFVANPAFILGVSQNVAYENRVLAIHFSTIFISLDGYLAY